MKTIIQKVTSRKLWISIAGVAAGIAIALGAEATEIETVTGAITALLSAVAYIITEGKIDAERAKTPVETAQNAPEGTDGE